MAEVSSKVNLRNGGSTAPDSQPLAERTNAHKLGSDGTAMTEAFRKSKGEESSGSEMFSSLSSEAEFDLSQENEVMSSEDIAQRLKERVISIVLGNLFTIIIVGVLYLNYVLFESYMGVFLYSFLASEALWDTKVFIVSKLQEVNDKTHVSPRRVVTGFLHAANEFLTNWRITWFLLFVLLAFALIFLPVLTASILLILTGTLLVLFTLDRNIFYMTRIHRMFFNDDTFVALMLIVFLLIAGLLFTTWFAIFTANDIKNMLHWISDWFEAKLLKGDWAQELWQDISQHGENALENALEDFEHQYVANTTYEPLFRWVVRYVDRTRQMAAAAGNSTGVGSGVDDCPAESPLHQVAPSYSPLSENWLPSFSLPIWAQNRSMVEMISFLKNYTESTDLSSISGKMQGVVGKASDGFWATALFTLSILFLVVDFGIRVGFFITITFILLSSKDNLMHDFLTGFFGGSQPPQPPPTATSQVEDDLDENLSDFADGIVSDDDQESVSSSIRVNGASQHQVPQVNGAAAAASISVSSDLTQIEKVLRRTIRGVLMLPVMMSIFHAATTFFLFKLLQVELQYLAASLSILLTVFPIIYAHWICLPWLLVYMINAQYSKAIILFLLHYLLYSVVDSWILSKLMEGSQKDRTKAIDHSKDAFLTGVSVFFGVTAFGAHGVLLGPLLVCLGLVSYDLFRDQQYAVQTYFSGNGGPTPYFRQRSTNQTPRVRRRMSSDPAGDSTPLSPIESPAAEPPPTPISTADGANSSFTRVLTSSGSFPSLGASKLRKYRTAESSAASYMPSSILESVFQSAASAVDSAKVPSLYASQKTGKRKSSFTSENELMSRRRKEKSP